MLCGMNLWSPLWNGIVDSSLWDEPDCVCKIFITLLALKDVDNIVRKTAYQIGHHSRKKESEVLEALKILQRPDKRRLEPQEHEGRRIKRVEEGWLILNGQKYRDLVKQEARRASLRKAQAKFRENQKLLRQGKPLPGEMAAVQALDNGDEAGADAIIEATLPQKKR